MLYLQIRITLFKYIYFFYTNYDYFINFREINNTFQLM